MLSGFTREPDDDVRTDIERIVSGKGVTLQKFSPGMTAVDAHKGFIMSALQTQFKPDHHAFSIFRQQVKNISDQLRRVMATFGNLDGEKAGLLDAQQVKATTALLRLLTSRIRDLLNLNVIESEDDREFLESGLAEAQGFLKVLLAR